MAAASKTTVHEEREIGQMAVWSLSTAKPGNGVEQLRDDNTETYWQYVKKMPAISACNPVFDLFSLLNDTHMSFIVFLLLRLWCRSDGPQPHLINIQFHKKMRVHEIKIYTDFKLGQCPHPSSARCRETSTMSTISIHRAPCPQFPSTNSSHTVGSNLRSTNMHALA